jgi:hypothetical protein
VQSVWKLAVSVTNRYLKILIAGRESKGKQQTKHKGRFVSTYTTKDLAAEKRRLKQIIANYDPQESPCQYNPSTGQMDCFSSCISYILDGMVCLEQKLFLFVRPSHPASVAAWCFIRDLQSRIDPSADINTVLSTANCFLLRRQVFVRNPIALHRFIYYRPSLN